MAVYPKNIGGRFNDLPRDIISGYVDPYVEGDIHLYRKIANEIYDEIILTGNYGFIGIEFLNKNAIINKIVNDLIDTYGIDLLGSAHPKNSQYLSLDELKNIYIVPIKRIIITLLEKLRFKYIGVEYLRILGGFQNAERESGYIITRNIVNFLGRNRFIDYTQHLYITIDIMPPTGASFSIPVLLTTTLNDIRTTLNDIRNTIGKSPINLPGHNNSQDLTIEQLGILSGDILYTR